MSKLKRKDKKAAAEPEPTFDFDRQPLWVGDVIRTSAIIGVCLVGMATAADRFC
jgi:hypothetical protein